MKFVPAGTPGVLFSIWETRVKDFEAFVEETDHDAISENRFGTKAYTLERTGLAKAPDQEKGRPHLKEVVAFDFIQKGGSWKDPRFPTKQTGEHPVVCVSCLDAEAFCAWLTKRECASGRISSTACYRLPTEAEWLCACGPTKFPWGDDWPPRSVDGNYFGKEGLVGGATRDSFYTRWTNLLDEDFRDGAMRTAPVGQFIENRFGLYDMGGNVGEWSATWYTAEMKPIAPMAPHGIRDYRAAHGGSWSSYMTTRVYSDSMSYSAQGGLKREDETGFRVVLSVAVGVAASSVATPVLLDKNEQGAVSSPR
jgi:formylglycine-generating enzyme required for sulfatase activity